MFGAWRGRARRASVGASVHAARDLSARRTLDAFAEVPAHIAVVRGPDHVYSFANDRYRRMAGIADPIGRPFGEKASAFELDVRAILDEVRRTGLAWSNKELHARPIGPDGVARDLWLSTDMRPILDAQGNVDGILVHAFDVSDQVRARKELEASEAAFRRLFESDMLGLAQWDWSGAITDANDEYLRIVGYDRDDLREGRIDWLAMTPPEFAERERRAHEEIAARGVCTPFYKEYVRKDGSRVPIFIGGGVLRDDTKRGVTFVLDLTERHEHARSRAEALLETVLSHAPLILSAFDRDGIITLAEGVALRVLGFEPRANIGRSIFEVFADDPIVLGHFRRALAGDEFEIQYRQGEAIFETHFRPLRDARGELAGSVGVSIDVTGRIRAEEARERLQRQLLQSQKLESLGVLAGGLAHDFNNLLTAILGNASLVLSRQPPDGAKQALEDIVSSARRAADLTRQMLAYSGKGHFEVRSIDLSRHVGEIARLLESSIPKKVQLELVLSTELPPIEVDVAQVQQVVMNLVLNGAEAIGDAIGIVRLRTYVRTLDEARARAIGGSPQLAPGRYVVLEVEDSGCGMDAATQERIFDPFFTTKFAGRGLGLAAVLGILRAHGGATHIESAPGRGTRFEVYFPAGTRPLDSVPPPRVIDAVGEGLVLVVDDERPLRQTVVRILEPLGFRTLQACNGREAIEIFRAHADEVRAVLLDLTMPELDGEATLHALRAIRPDVRVVLSSGYDPTEALADPTVACVSFLQKPYTADELVAQIRLAIDASAS